MTEKIEGKSFRIPGNGEKITSTEHGINMLNFSPNEHPVQSQTKSQSLSVGVKCEVDGGVPCGVAAAVAALRL